MQAFPKIMGILNVTPDSFSDGGSLLSVTDAVNRALKMTDEGADWIDIGGETTKPGAVLIDTETEIYRVIPVIDGIKKIYPNIRISVDTTKYDVAVRALDLGCNMLNDVSCLRNEPRLAELAGKFDVPLVIMHSRGTPQNMQNSPHYKNLWDELINELDYAMKKAAVLGAKEIIADPGIGFAKSFEHNIEILKNFENLYKLNKPLLLGISRKAFTGRISGLELASERDNTTAFIHALLLKHNVDYIRVHNVKRISELKKVFEALN